MKNGIKAMLGHFGYEIHRIQKEPTGLGQDPFWDMKRLVGPARHPLIFDVGANIGQSIQTFRKYFDQPVIHSFEPGADAFKELQRRSIGIPDLFLNNIALGSRSGSKNLFECVAGSEMNSLLEPRSEGWGGGKVKGKQQVYVSTIDEYCEENGINSINILKTDAQGFDFEIIKGGERMIQRKAVELVYMEILFSDMYMGQPRLDEIYGFLADHGFILVTFYPFYYWGDKASWTEALFAHPDFKTA